MKILKIYNDNPKDDTFVNGKPVHPTFCNRNIEPSYSFSQGCGYYDGISYNEIDAFFNEFNLDGCWDEEYNLFKGGYSISIDISKYSMKINIWLREQKFKKLFDE